MATFEERSPWLSTFGTSKVRFRSRRYTNLLAASSKIDKRYSFKIFSGFIVKK
jgi:hypothetical protein